MNSRSISISTGIVATILVGWVLHVGAAIIQPFVIAVLLCVLLRPVVAALAKAFIPPVVTVVALVVLLFYGASQVAVVVQSNALTFVGEMQDGVKLKTLNEAQETLAKSGTWGQILVGLHDQVESWELPEGVADLTQYGLRTLEEQKPDEFLAGLGLMGVGTGFDFARALVIIVIYMLFIFAEQAVFRSKALSVAGDRQQEVADALDTIAVGIQRYLGVKTVTSLATGVLCYAALLWLEIPYALLWGFLTFLLNYIPTFGSIIAGIFPAVVALAVGGDASLTGVEKAVIVVFVYLTVNLTLGSFVEPKILGRELNLSPLVIVVSVVVWAGIWGVVGTFLAVPITATIQIVLASQESTRPLAILLSSGPPRPGRRRLLRRKNGDRVAA